MEEELRWHNGKQMCDQFTAAGDIVMENKLI